MYELDIEANESKNHWTIEHMSLVESENNTPAVILGVPSTRCSGCAFDFIIKNNLFEYRDLDLLQLLGTAMGTSAACMWAIIYYSVHGIGSLIPNYNQYLTWEFEELATSINFLHLTISIEKSRISTKT